MSSNTDDKAKNQQRRNVERAKYNAAYFECEYWKEDLPGYAGNRGLSYDDPQHLNRFLFLAKELVELFSFETVLDAGCGPGGMVNALTDFSKKAIGVDVSLSAATLARSNQTSPNRIVVGAVDQLPFESGSFDLVWCSDVMEHLPGCDLKAAINELARVAVSVVALTINLDNPYFYHPSILTRNEWDKLFVGSGRFVKDELTTNLLDRSLKQTYVEYDAFVYRKP